MKNLKITAFMIAVFAFAFLLGSVETTYAQRGEGSMQWSGTVDNTVQITIRNRNARTRTLSGRAYYDENFNFDGRAPRRNSDVRLDKQDGRGRIYVVQQPSRRNNWTTIVQIVDSKGGADRYRFTLDWD